MRLYVDICTVVVSTFPVASWMHFKTCIQLSGTNNFVSPRQKTCQGWCRYPAGTLSSVRSGAKVALLSLFDSVFAMVIHYLSLREHPIGEHNSPMPRFKPPKPTACENATEQYLHSEGNTLNE